MAERCMLLHLILTWLVLDCYAQILAPLPTEQVVEVGKNVDILWSYGNVADAILVEWKFTADSSAKEILIMDQVPPTPPYVKGFFNCRYNSAKNGGITITNVTTNNTGIYKISVGYSSSSAEGTVKITVKGTTTSSTSTAIPITSPTSATTTHLVTPNTTSSTSTSTTTTTTASIATSTTTTTSIKTSTRTTNSTVPTHFKTQSEQDNSKIVVIVVPSVVGGLFVIGVAVTVALVWKFRKNQTLHSNRSKHHKEGHSKKKDKGRHLKRHPEYSEYNSSHHRGFSAKEMYGYKMYSGQCEIKSNPLYSHHLDRHLNVSYVTNRGQYGYDQQCNGNQFLVYQMPSAGADPLYTRRGHIIHPEHRYQYSTNPRATTLRTQDNTIVTDYSWNWN